MGYIYKIGNTVNQKVYIGQTKGSLNKRFKSHKSSSKRKNYLLYKAFNKYGIDKFYIEKIEEVDNSLLDEREIYWISFYDSFKNGYNLTPGGNLFTKENNPMVVNPDSIKKHKKSMKKATYWKSDEWKEIQRKKWTGEGNPSKSEKNRKKISERVSGENNPACNPLVREKISKSRIGKTASLETRKKMSINNGRYWKGKKTTTIYN